MRETGSCARRVTPRRGGPDTMPVRPSIYDPADQNATLGAGRRWCEAAGIAGRSWCRASPAAEGRETRTAQRPGALTGPYLAKRNPTRRRATLATASRRQFLHRTQPRKETNRSEVIDTESETQ